MAAQSSTSPQLDVNTSKPPSPRTLDRLRKRLAREKQRSPSILGVKIRRVPEFESYSGSSRGTLGGFLPVCELGSPDIDNLGLEREGSGEKECVFTQFTKRVGLGIYTRTRDAPDKKADAEGHAGLDGDERDTWYMFYPPPPSPSLVLRPEDSDSASAPETDGDPDSASPPDLPSAAEFDATGPFRLSSLSEGSLYAFPNPRSPTGYQPNQDNVYQTDDLSPSAEHFAEQYGDLLRRPDTVPGPRNDQTGSKRHLSPSPIPSPYSVRTQMQEPKTIRKVKRQHSLRRLINTPPRSQSVSARTNPGATTSTPSPPLLPMPLPTFLPTTLPPALRLHPTRLSLAAHPTRSPTLASHDHRYPKGGEFKPRSNKRPRRDPSPPPDLQQEQQQQQPNHSGGGARAGNLRPKAWVDHDPAGAREREQEARLAHGGGDGLGERAVRRGRRRSRETRRYGMVELEDRRVDGRGGGGWV